MLFKKLSISLKSSLLKYRKRQGCLPSPLLVNVFREIFLIENKINTLFINDVIAWIVDIENLKVILSSMVATNHRYLLSTWNVAGPSCATRIGQILDFKDVV